MTLANYPKGFSNGLMVQGVPIMMAFSTSQAALGNTAKSGVYWVDNTNGLDGNPGTYTLPLKTLARAVAIAAQYDIVMLKPGHAETISSSTALTMSVANLSVVGIGTGAIRPTFTLDTATTARVNVTAAGVSFANCVFIANFADIATVFTLTTAKDFISDACEFRDTSSILNFLTVVTTNSTDNAADGLMFIGNRVFGAGTTAATTPIKLGGNTDRVTINSNYINLAVLNNTSAVLAHTSKVVTNLEMSDNRVFRPNTDTATGGILITTSSTTNTGMVYNNKVQAADVAAAILVTAGSIYGMFNNLYDGDADASGFVLPAIGAN